MQSSKFPENDELLETLLFGVNNGVNNGVAGEVVLLAFIEMPLVAVAVPVAMPVPVPVPVGFVVPVLWLELLRVARGMVLVVIPVVPVSSWPSVPSELVSWIGVNTSLVIWSVAWELVS